MSDVDPVAPTVPAVPAALPALPVPPAPIVQPDPFPTPTPENVVIDDVAAMNKAFAEWREAAAIHQKNHDDLEAMKANLAAHQAIYDQSAADLADKIAELQTASAKVDVDAQKVAV
ncbi:MAG: hypothetical protein JOZ73_12045 [Solirubrobacterales bacterium]|nr:hypothetical protein [Solirubrobacterales bacterium]